MCLETCGQSCNWAVTAVVFFVVAPFASFYLWLACVVCKSVAIGAVVVGCKHARAFMPRCFSSIFGNVLTENLVKKLPVEKPGKCERRDWTLLRIPLMRVVARDLGTPGRTRFRSRVLELSSKMSLLQC